MYRWIAVVLAGAVLLLAAGCGESDDDTAPAESAATGESAKTDAATQFETIEPGVLKAATELGFPPLRVEENGEYSGMELDLVEIIAERLGFKEVEFINTTFDTVFTGLAANKWDMVADATFGWADESSPSLEVVNERTEIVSFTRPWFFPTYVLLSSEKHNPGLMTPDQLKEGMRVSAQKGGSDFFWAEKELAPAGIKVVPRRNLAESLPTILSGSLDATIEDLSIALAQKKDHPELQTGERIPPISSAGYAFAFAPEGEKLRAAFDAELGKLVESGEYEKMFKQYFPELPMQELPDNAFVHESAG